MKREQLTNVTTESIDQRCHNLAEHAAYVAHTYHETYLAAAVVYVREQADRIIALRSQQVTP